MRVEDDMRYRLDVVAPCVVDAVKFAGGWLVDRVMAGWDVTVLVGADEDVRPLEILGVDTADLESVLTSWEDRPHPQTVAVAAELFNTDERVRRGVLGALEQGRTEVTLWGEECPAELSVDPVRHELSAAARAFKAQALAAVNDLETQIVCASESFRCGVMTSRSVPADLIPAS